MCTRNVTYFFPQTRHDACTPTSTAPEARRRRHTAHPHAVADAAARGSRAACRCRGSSAGGQSKNHDRIRISQHAAGICARTPRLHASLPPARRASRPRSAVQSARSASVHARKRHRSNRDRKLCTVLFERTRAADDTVRALCTRGADERTSDMNATSASRRATILGSFDASERQRRRRRREKRARAGAAERCGRLKVQQVTYASNGIVNMGVSDDVVDDSARGQLNTHHQ